MDIKISLVLKDEVYGFSDLLDGRELNDQTKKEIIELIKEDVGFAFDQQIEVEELSITNVVVPNGTLVCNDDKKSICNNPMSHECCNKHHKRI